MANVVGRRIIETAEAPILDAPLSQGVLMGNTLYLAGQVEINAEGDVVAGFEAQTRLTLDNLGFILKAAGASFKHVTKTTVLLTDISQAAAFNAIYAEYFPKPHPVRTMFEIPKLAVPGLLVEVDAIAVLGNIVDE